MEKGIFRGGALPLWTVYSEALALAILASASACLLACCTCGKVGPTLNHPEAPLRGTFVPRDSSTAKWSMSFLDDSTARLEIRTGDSVFQAVYSVRKNGTHQVNRSPQ